MRLIRRLTVILFIIVAIIFGFFRYNIIKSRDYSEPVFVIQNEDEVLSVSVNATDDELKQGVTAYDKKDGDLTSEIQIESISKFIKGHQCNVTYVCADSDDHVVKKTRRIEFSDYVSPRFTLNRQLCLYVGENTDVADIVGAVDCYDAKSEDGNITRKLKILSSSVTAKTSGEYTFTAQVTNSLGDTSKLQAVVVVRQRNNLEPRISLKENIVYLNKDSKFDPMDYVDSAVTASGAKLKKKDVTISKTSVDMEKEGCYSVEYSIKDPAQNEGFAYLTVVVR